MEEILQLARKKAEQAEVYQVISHSTPLLFEANRLKHVLTRESSGTALRLIKNGRLGFAQISGRVNAEELVDMALETAKYGAEAKFDFPGTAEYTHVDTFDPATEGVSIEDMAELGQRLIDKVRVHTAEIICEAQLSCGTAGVSLINSRGGQAHYKKSYFSLGVEGVLMKGDDMLYVGDGQSSCHPIADIEPIANEVMLQLELAKQNAVLHSGTLPVILTPHGMASALISPLLSAFNGKVVYNGASPLKDKLGSRVFDSKITLWDDATIPFQVASGPCDDEGVPAGRVALIQEGVVSHFLYDLQTAGLAGAKSTGNGGRGSGLPSPSPNALVLKGGNVPQQNMLDDIGEGLMIYQLMGATQGNILNGDFSGNVLLGYKIEKGKITGRVKDSMVSGNVYKLLGDVRALGNDSRWVDGILNTPSIYLPALSVAVKGR